MYVSTITITRKVLYPNILISIDIRDALKPCETGLRQTKRAIVKYVKKKEEAELYVKIRISE
jgi:hypothetical protein